MVTKGTFNSSNILTIHVSPIVTSTFKFKNYIVETVRGVEQRMCRRLEYLSEISLGTLTYDISCADGDRKSFDEFLDFYQKTARGSLNSFLYKNPLDFKGTYNLVAHKENTFSRILLIEQSRTATFTTYIPVKEYRFGILRGYKTLHYLDESTIEVWQEDTANPPNLMKLTPGQFAYDLSTGLVTIPNATTTPKYVSAEFYLQYRFRDDALQYSQQSSTVINIDNVGLVELPVKSHSRQLLSTIDFGGETELPTLDIGFTPTYSREVTLDAYIDRLETSGRELRQERYLENKDLINLDGNVLYTQEKDNLLCAFLACRGTFQEFTYGEIAHARFDSDEFVLETRIEGEQCG